MTTYFTEQQPDDGQVVEESQEPKTGENGAAEPTEQPAVRNTGQTGNCPGTQ